MGAKAVFPILVEVVGGGAPEEAVVTTLGCAACILLAHEEEGKLAELTISISKLHLHN